MTALSSTSVTFLTNISNILQKVIAPAIEQILPTKTIFYDMLEKNKGVTSMANNTFYITLRTGRHSGIAAINEGATLPSGRPSYSQATVSAKWLFGTFDITDQVLESAKGNPGSLVNYLTQQTSDLKDDFAKELNRIFMGDGSAQIALANANATSTTLTVKPSLSVNTDIAGTEYLAPGMKLLVGTDTATVSSVESDTSCTITSAITYAVNDVITKADGDGVVASEPMGVDGIIATTGTLQGIDRASYPWYQAAYVDTTSEALGLSKMETAWAKCLKYGNPKYVIMNTTLWKKYGNLLESYKRTATMKEVLSGGWSGLDFMGGAGTVLLDTDCPDGKVFFIDPSSITIAQLTPISWVDRGDGLLRRVDYAAWQGVLRWYGNLAALNPKANAKLTAKTG
jgi:hypothetical protein